MIRDLGNIVRDDVKSRKGETAACLSSLASASDLVQLKKYRAAQTAFQKLIADDPENPALLFAMGFVRQQEDDWDDAYDAYESARDLMPGLSDIHSRLAYVLYRSDDGDGAIAEARTTLSIDPTNAEAYRFLGLGLYATRKYPAAIHAFQQSLVRQPNNPEVYYDLGITLRDQGDVDAAAAAYRKAIALKPAFWEAHNNLGMLLHDLRSSMAQSRNIARPNDWLRKSPRYATTLATLIATRATTTTLSQNSANCFAWIPPGRTGIAVWLGH